MDMVAINQKEINMKALAIIVFAIVMILKIVPNYKAAVKYGKMAVDRYKVGREYIAGVHYRRLVLRSS